MPKSKIEQYKQFQDYTNYIDTSDVMLDFYQNEQGKGLEKYFLMIEEWLAINYSDPNSNLSVQNNYPLVIQGNGGVGKKTLLVKWYEYHQSTKKNQSRKDLMILHFATTGGNNSNYFYAIYRILIKLREELNIGQKVELHEEKIRKYFSYWLDVCDQKIQNESFHDLQTAYDKIIIVLQGIDYFIDRGSGRQGNIAFWLPKYFPKNVKVIVTADGQSQSMKYFNNLGCHKVMIPSDLSLVRNMMMKRKSEKELCISGKIKDMLFRTLEQIINKINVTSLFVKSYLQFLIPEKIKECELKEQSLQFLQKQLEQIDHNKLKSLLTTEELFDYLLEFWGSRLLLNQQKFKSLLGVLIHTQKGLTRSEIVSITNISPQELKLFITLFRTFLMNFKDLWMIKNDCFKKAINSKYEFQISDLSDKIAESLKRTPNSVRKLQEETFQLYTAGNYFRLKQVISDVQNFLLLFNPYTKYDLCKYWQKLQEKSFDPVIQYNKAIEGFEMHYHPTPDDLFRIITQISRFLKEFSDFETYYTPEFRHPQITGNQKELDDLGILGEFRNLGMCFNQLLLSPQNKQEECRKVQEMKEEEGQVDKGEIRLRNKIQQVYQKIQQVGKNRKSNTTLDKSQISSKQVPQQYKPKKNKKKKNTIHQLNVQIKSNQQAFRKHYHEQIKPFLQKFQLDGNKEINLDDNKQDLDYQDSDKEEDNSNNLVAKIKSIEREKQKQKSKYEQLPNLKNVYAKIVEEQFQLNQKPPANYYYKRWIWMQFPWVCMAMKCDYSDKLRKCFTSPTSYMPVSEERQFTLQALKIALQAKRKKQAILEKTEQTTQFHKKRKETALAPLTDTSKVHRNQTKFDESLMTTKSKTKNKLQQLGFVTNSFLSLRNLEKQMNQVSKNLATSNLKKNNNKNSQKLDNTPEGNSVFLTSQQRTYEQYSSLLHSINKKKKKKPFTEDDLNMTSASNLRASENKQGLLPRIKQNINNQMIGQLEQLEKNNSNMRKQVDSYLYKNKVLAKKLKQLKIIQYNNTNALNNEKKLQQTKSKIDQYENKIQQVRYEYAYSILEHQRLNVLIKICQQNKTQNQECIPDLVFECNNLKKMINLQKKDIEELHIKIEQIKKLMKNFLKNCYEKVKNQAILNEQISNTLKNRDMFQEEVQKYDEIILEEIQEKRKELNDRVKSIYTSQNQETHLNSAQKEKNITRKSNFYNSGQNSHVLNNGSNCIEQNYEEIYNKIMEHLGVEGTQMNHDEQAETKEEPYQKSQKYIRLLNGLAKKKQLEAIIGQRKSELEQLSKKCKQQKKLLDTLILAENTPQQQATQPNSQQNSNAVNKQQQQQQQFDDSNPLEIQDILNKKLHEKQRNIKKLTEVKLSCLGMLNTWYKQLNLQEKTELKLTPEFLSKLGQVYQKQKDARVELQMHKQRNGVSINEY